MTQFHVWYSPILQRSERTLTDMQYRSNTTFWYRLTRVVLDEGPLNARVFDSLAGERPYQCQACGKSYRQRVDLRLHLKRVHHDSSPALIQKKNPVPQLIIEAADTIEDPAVARSELILDGGTVE